MLYQKVGVIGLGLIGGSIAKVLKEKGYYVATVKSKSPDIAKAKNILDKVFSDLESLVKEVDLIIIATPLTAILPLARKIKSNRPLLVIDVGSVKGAIVEEFAKLTKGPVEFLSTHPMAGSEKSGFDASDPNLFKGAPWIIVPHKKNKTKLASWIQLFGAKPIVMTAEEHDRKTALISHLPALISKALLEFVQEKDAESLKIAGPGFRSMTRLANGNKQLTDEIEAFNQKNLAPLWKEWIHFLKRPLH